MEEQDGYVEGEHEPVECPCENEVVVDRQLVQALSKVTLVYQPASLIDDDQCVDNPGVHCQDKL